MPPQVAAQMGSRTMTHCVKTGERKWSDRDKRQTERRASKCQQTDVKVESNKIMWKLTCADGTSGEGTITHNGKDAYKMDSVINSPQVGAIKTSIEGRKIADSCEK